MSRSLLLGVCIVAFGVLAAQAETIPVYVSAGNVTMNAVRIPYNTTYDEVAFYLTGMLSAAKGLDQFGHQININTLAGTWTATGGAFYLNSSSTGWKAKVTNANTTPPNSWINLDSAMTVDTIFARGPQTSGNEYGNFGCDLYTLDYTVGLTYPDPDAGTVNDNGFDNTLVATLYVTKNTSTIVYDGQLGFSYGNGTMENVHFALVPEPGTLVSLGSILLGAAVAIRRRRR